MKTVRVNASSSYDVIIGKGILDSLGEKLQSAVGACRLCLVTDDVVDSLYSKKATASLEAAGYSYEKFVIANGEASKNTANLIALLEFLAEKRFTRKDCIIALGGGVVGDLAGFAAGVFLRGIRFVQVPTTLLAAVDSSVGGKTAVDLVAGKNLAGVFHQPSLVLCDVSTLDTLEPRIFSDGCAEVIKYAVINDRPMFDRLGCGIKNNVEEIIADCVTHKAEIVAKDEFDNGCRQLLNLGHTVGHAIELCSNLKISHGSAVAIGTVLVTKMAVALGICPEEDLYLIEDMLKTEGLPTRCDFSAEELAALATADKKRSGDTITLIVPYGIGNCKPLKISVNELVSYIKKGL
ncbi:MAG: 3-dehydroquinate synthase [Ruminococcaceae bacterium]|nr:3-dehydroquinate synthase [Oscillospiraceae bacterium]